MTDSIVFRAVRVVWIRFAASITGSWPIVTAGVAASASTTASAKNATPGPSERNVVVAGRGRHPSVRPLTPTDPPSREVIGSGIEHSPFDSGGARHPRLRRARARAATQLA